MLHLPKMSESCVHTLDHQLKYSIGKKKVLYCMNGPFKKILILILYDFAIVTINVAETLVTMVNFYKGHPTAFLPPQTAHLSNWLNFYILYCSGADGTSAWFGLFATDSSNKGSFSQLCSDSPLILYTALLRRPVTHASIRRHWLCDSNYPF